MARTLACPPSLSPHTLRLCTETIQLCQQLVDGVITLVITTRCTSAPRAADGVELINEDDAGRQLTCLQSAAAGMGLLVGPSDGSGKALRIALARAMGLGGGVLSPCCWHVTDFTTGLFAHTSAHQHRQPPAHAPACMLQARAHATAHTCSAHR